jgi:hypothetical protein
MLGRCRVFWSLLLSSMTFLGEKSDNILLLCAQNDGKMINYFCNKSDNLLLRKVDYEMWGHELTVPIIEFLSIQCNYLISIYSNVLKKSDFYL